MASEYAVGSAFESCPAATGAAGCLDFPDGAHRCGKGRPHVVNKAGHACTCGFGWVTVTIGDGHMLAAPAPARRIRPDMVGHRREGNTL